MKLHIQNFQGIKNCEIDLEFGNVYPLIGKNGAGKTSILKALEKHTFKIKNIPDFTQPIDVYLRHVKSHASYLTSICQFNFSKDQKIFIRNEISKVFNKNLDIVDENFDDTLSLYENGMTCYLLHLIALLKVEKNTVLAFESPEISLHPSAIRNLVATFNHFAKEMELVILLVTYSNVVLNEFTKDPQNVLVISPNKTIPLNKIHNENWLSHFMLGDLYERCELDL